MLVELKEASITDGRELFEMIAEIGPGENGFVDRSLKLTIGY